MCRLATEYFTRLTWRFKVDHDALVRQRIAEAEASQPMVAVQVLSMRDAIQKSRPDPDYSRFQEIYQAIGEESRPTLVQDYLVYCETIDTIKAMRSCLIARYRPGPVLERLQRIGVRPPRNWHICHVCEGNGLGEIGYCRTCSGHGYRT